MNPMEAFCTLVDRESAGQSITHSSRPDKVYPECRYAGTRGRYDRAVKRYERVRLYPSQRQAEALERALDITRQLYNALLMQRRDAWRTRRLMISGRRQYAEITELRAADARFASLYRDLEDAVLRRLDVAFAAFFRRGGFPRFKGRSQWHTLVFPHGKRALDFDAQQGRVRIPGIGTVRLRKGRAVPSFGRAWLSRKNNRWYAVFECTGDVDALPASGHTVGIDRGVHVLVATSDGRIVPNPAPLLAASAALARAQRTLERRTTRDACGRVVRPSKRRGVAQAIVARLHERIANARRDAAHKLSRELVDGYDVIAIEALAVRNMTRSTAGNIDAPGTRVRAKSALNRRILDAAWTCLKKLICEKAERAARLIVEVDPKNTSRTCSRCGHVAAESRRRLAFVCVACGHAMHADVNAAIVIRQRAESQPAARRAPLGDVGDPQREPHAGAEPARRI